MGAGLNSGGLNSQSAGTGAAILGFFSWLGLGYGPGRGPAAPMAAAASALMVAVAAVRVQASLGRNMRSTRTRGAVLLLMKDRKTKRRSGRPAGRHSDQSDSAGRLSPSCSAARVTGSRGPGRCAATPLALRLIRPAGEVKGPPPTSESISASISAGHGQGESHAMRPLHGPPPSPPAERRRPSSTWNPSEVFWWMFGGYQKYQRPDGTWGWEQQSYDKYAKGTIKTIKPANLRTTWHRMIFRPMLARDIPDLDLRYGPLEFGECR